MKPKNTFISVCDHLRRGLLNGTISLKEIEGDPASKSLSLVILGAPGSGKSSFVAALYGYLSSAGLVHSESKPSRKFSTSGLSFTSSTHGIETGSFYLQARKPVEVHWSIHDAGVVESFQIENLTVRSADAVLFFISGPELFSEPGRSRNTDGLLRSLRQYRTHIIVIVITKIDLLSEDQIDRRTLHSQVEFVFPDLFQEGSDWIVGIVPFSLVKPRLASVPIDFSVWAKYEFDKGGAREIFAEDDDLSGAFANGRLLEG